MIQRSQEPPEASFETPFLTKWLLRMRAVVLTAIAGQVLDARSGADAAAAPCHDGVT